MTVQISKIIDTYLSLRADKEAVEAKAKEKVAKIKEDMAKLEAYIKQRADEQGVDSFKTKVGTAFLTTVDFAQVADWDATLEFIKDNEAYDLLEKRVSKRAVRGYIEEQKEVPAGINYGTRIDVNVRRPANKVDDDE